MATHLAFLRAINLGPKRTFPKDDIRRVTEAVGFEHVETHINTGNVRFDTSMRARARIEERLEAAFLADRGFEVPTVSFTTAEFAAIASDAERLSAERPGLVRHYVYLLKDEPSTDRIRRVEALSSEAGEMVVHGRAAHALLGEGYRGGQVDPLGAAPLLGTATNRNLNVVTAIAAKWC